MVEFKVTKINSNGNTELFLLSKEEIGSGIGLEQYLSLLLPVRQSGAAVEHNDVKLLQFYSLACFFLVPLYLHSCNVGNQSIYLHLIFEILLFDTSSLMNLSKIKCR